MAELSAVTIDCPTEEDKRVQQQQQSKGALSAMITTL